MPSTKQRRKSKAPSFELVQMVYNYFQKVYLSGARQTTRGEIAERLGYCRNHISQCLKILENQNRIKKGDSYGFWEINIQKEEIK